MGAFGISRTPKNAAVIPIDQRGARSDASFHPAGKSSRADGSKTIRFVGPSDPNPVKASIEKTVSFAAEAGQLQLNAFEPIIAHSLFKSLLHLRQACITLDQRCVRGISANKAHMEATVRHSIGIVTALNPYIGYENASAIAKEAHASGSSVYDLVLSKGLLSRTELERILRPENLTRPGTLATRTGTRTGGKARQR